MNELEYIRSLTMQRQPSPPGVMLGLGDDCAVIRKDSQRVQLLSMDTLVETVHFERRFHPPALLGRKVVSVNVSDIAAMGGTPLWILIDLVAHSSTPLSRIRGLYDGMIAATRQWNMGILGGDTAEGDTLELHITGVGRIPRNTAVLRSSAKTGARPLHAGSVRPAPDRATCTAAPAPPR